MQNLVRQVVLAIGSVAIAEVRLIAQVSWDLETMHAIAVMLSSEFQIEAKVSDAHRSIAAPPSVYESCDLLISNRLHSLLIAGAAGSHILACVNAKSNAKIVGLFETVGWRDNLLTLGSASEAEIREAIERTIVAPVKGSATTKLLREGFAQAVRSEGQ